MCRRCCRFCGRLGRPGHLHRKLSLQNVSAMGGAQSGTGFHMDMYMSTLSLQIVSATGSAQSDWCLAMHPTQMCGSLYFCQCNTPAGLELPPMQKQNSARGRLWAVLYCRGRTFGVFSAMRAVLMGRPERRTGSASTVWCAAGPSPAWHALECQRANCCTVLLRAVCRCIGCRPC